MAEMTAIERIQTTIRCEKPDRGPISLMMGFSCAHYKGVTIEKFLNDCDLARDLMIQVFNEFGGWDATYSGTSLNEFAFALTLPMRLKVPGREMPSDTIWQFDEASLIEVEDYDFAIEHGYEALQGKLFPRVRPHMDPSQFPVMLNQWLGQAVKDTHIWE